MPYTRRRRYVRKRRPARAKNTYVRKVARYEAKKVVARQIETKIYDTNATAQAIDYTTGVIVSPTANIIRGVGENNYIADAITPVGISFRCQLMRADSTQLIRIIVIQNKAGGVPLLSTLLQSVGNVTTPLSPLDIDYNDTYKVLYDRLISMDSIRGTTYPLTIRIPRKKLRLLKFLDTTGGIEKGGIYFCFISDSAIANHPTLDYRCRFYFKDA